MTIRTLALATAGLCLLAATPALAEPEPGSDCATLWDIEKEIYKGRAAGDMSYYASISARSYLGWPPQFGEPADYEALIAGFETFDMAPGEVIDLTYGGCTIDGDSGIIFYSTHRTQMSGGAPADERFETIHVFHRHEDGWQLMGGMARPQPDRPGE